METIDYMNSSFKLKDFITTVKFHRKFYEEHPDWFEPEGLLTFCGKQGSGKTLTAVDYIIKLANDYPKSILVTNVDIKGLPKNYKVIIFKTLDEIINYFDFITNGEYGVIYFIDEIQVLFNALLKRGMSVQVLEAISQQRKQRKHIIGTAQIFKKIDKVFREQMNHIVMCACYFKCFQLNRFVLGETVVEKDNKISFDVKKYFWFFHNPEMYSKYDTSAVISAYRKEFNNSVLSDEVLAQFIKNNIDILPKKESE